MRYAGWEIASHGLKWVEHKDMSEAEERAQIAEAIRLQTEVTGAAPRGWYTGRCSMNTMRLVAETGQFAYVADSYADDLPYWAQFGTQDQLVVPYTLDCNDMRFAVQAGFTTGDQFETYLKDSFDFLYREGQAGAPKMLSIGLHCRLVGRPGRAAALARVIEHMKAREGVWFASRLDIAKHWMRTHPPIRRPRPSDMDRGTFVSEFGDIFENSPWIAEGAWNLELGLTHDTAKGVHQALKRVFRSANEEQRLSVLKAYPSIADTLAAAGRLISAGAVEHADAGLCMFTDKDQTILAQLNQSYTAKFGFPFIIAIKDNSNANILAAFRNRLDSDLEAEFDRACGQVERIAELRLIEKFST